MPIYTYICPLCLHQFDLFRPMVERDARPPCPRCQKTEPDIKAVRIFAIGNLGIQIR